MIILPLKPFQEQKGNETRQTTLLEQLAQKGSEEETAIVMALDMLFAGIDTSSHSIGFILYQLGEINNFSLPRVIGWLTHN